jgi:membrane-bound metal-dependent hydrolase YbcI (DUF457 family)
MGVGHFGLGLAAKRLEPGISLGTLIFAVMLADLVCFPLLIAGVERVHVLAGVATNRMVGDFPWSHSLLMDVVWGGLVAGAFFLWRRNRSGALLLFGAVVSHWVLDVVSHRPDMQFAPGVAAVLGFGLWNSFPATLIVEGGLWVMGVVVYLRATRAKGRAGAILFWAGALLLTLAWEGNVRRGMDPDPVRAGVGGVIFFSMVIGWAYGVDRLRSSGRIGDRASR